jgi:hypothetical protein
MNRKSAAFGMWTVGSLTKQAGARSDLAMNQNTRHFLDDDEFERLFTALHKTHKPQRPALKPKNLQAIGKIIVSFQRLEMTTRSFVGFLADIMGTSIRLNDIFTTKISFNNLLTILLTLAREKKYNRLDDLKHIIKKASTAEEIRNEIVHSIWSSGPRFKTQITRQRGLTLNVERYEEQELEKIADQISKIDTAVSALCADYIDWCQNAGATPRGVLYVT